MVAHKEHANAKNCKLNFFLIFNYKLGINIFVIFYSAIWD